MTNEFLKEIKRRLDKKGGNNWFNAKEALAKIKEMK